MSILLHFIQSLDFSVYRLLNGFAGNWYLDRLARFEEGNNLLRGGLFLAVYVYVWFRVGPRQEKQRREVLAIFAGTLLSLVVCRTIADLAPLVSARCTI